MKVSVVIPIYKTEKFLSECIASVLGQTLTDLEVILVNDGSPDNSYIICEQYAKQDNRVRYFYQENAGVSVARNVGLKHACGDFIFVMDSDDTINSEFLEKAYNRAVQEKSDIVVLGEWFANRMPRPPALPIMALFFRRSFYENYCDVIFPVGIQPCEDGLFSHQLLALTDNISYEPDVFYFYRQHDTSNHVQVNNQCEKVLSQIPQWFQILIGFYNRYDLWNKRAGHLLRFLEHEPFEFRLTAMPFTTEQKEMLFNLIHNFYNDYLAGKVDLSNITRQFRLCLTARSYDDWCRKNKIKKFFVNLIPIRKIRHKLKSNI